MIDDEQSCSSMKTSAIPLAPLDIPSCMPQGDGAGGAENIRCEDEAATGIIIIRRIFVSAWKHY